MRRHLIGLFACFIGVLSAGEARAQLTVNSLERFCSENRSLTARRTTIIIDPSSIAGSDETWWRQLISLERLDLQPREAVQVLVINPSTNAAEETLNTCFPAYTQQEIATLEGRRSPIDRVIGQAPANVARETQTLFRTRLQTALAAARNRARAGATADMLAAIAGLPNRFRDPNVYNRVIIYSRMRSQAAASVMNVGASERERAWGRLFAQNAINIGLGEFFIYGVPANLAEGSRQFWEDYFLTQGGIVTALAPSLQLTGSARIGRVRNLLNGEWSLAGRNSNGTARLRFAVDTERNVPLGVASFYIGRVWINVPFQGTYSCSNNSCRLSGVVLKTVPYGSPDPYFREQADRISLSGAEGALQGTLAVADPIRDGATGQAYRLSFSN